MGGRVASNSSKIELILDDASIAFAPSLRIISKVTASSPFTLAYDEKSFRSFTLSWFKNSSLNELLKHLSLKKVKVYLTTDHGTIKVDKPVLVKANKETNNNIRFKVGKNINTDNDKIYYCENGEKINLPRHNIFTKYLFATDNNYLLYSKNYNFHSKNFKDTFQHGGISMEEMIIPFIELFISLFLIFL